MNKSYDFKKLIENPKFLRITVVIGVCAVVLIFMSSFIDISSFHRAVDSDEYCSKLEENLLSIVSQIEGVGEAKIFLTMDNISVIVIDITSSPLNTTNYSIQNLYKLVKLPTIEYYQH